jgi:hypothetical protein
MIINGVCMVAALPCSSKMAARYTKQMHNATLQQQYLTWPELIFRNIPFP